MRNFQIVHSAFPVQLHSVSLLTLCGNKWVKPSFATCYDVFKYLCFSIIYSTLRAGVPWDNISVRMK